MVAGVKTGTLTVDEVRVDVLPDASIDNSSFLLARGVVSSARPEKVPLLPVLVPIFQDVEQRIVSVKLVPIGAVEQLRLVGSVHASTVMARMDTSDEPVLGRDEVVVQEVRFPKGEVSGSVKVKVQVLEGTKEPGIKPVKTIAKAVVQAAVLGVVYRTNSMQI